MELTDDLINKVRKGDRNAQRTLYDTYSAKMYGVCLRYAPDRERARDILQDSFIKVFSSIGSFRGEGSLEGWIRKIVVNSALEYLRKQKDYFSIDTVQVQNLQFDSANTDYDMQIILKVIAGLPPQYRAVFNLYAIEDYSHAEIAEMLNITESTSKSNYSRARAILRGKLEKMAEFRL